MAYTELSLDELEHYVNHDMPSFVRGAARELLRRQRALEADRSNARCLLCDSNVTEVYQCTQGHVLPMHYLATPTLGGSAESGSEEEGRK